MALQSECCNFNQFITGHVIYNPAYTYKFQLKTTFVFVIRKNEWPKSFLNQDLSAVDKNSSHNSWLTL